MTVTDVRFGTTSVPFTVVNATTITTTAPTGLTGAQNVFVTTSAGTSAVSASFTYTAAGPTITNLNPNNGPAAGGTSVVITGTNLTGVTGVTFGGVAGTGITANTATSVTVTSPAGSGAANVIVTTAGGSSGALTFTYAAALTAPVITSPSTANATEGTPFNYTITASGNPAPAIATGFNATGLPAWLTRTNNVVSGTPPAGSGNSSATFTVTAANSEGTSPGVLVTVNIAEPSAGWTITYSFPVPPTVFSESTGRIPLANFTGWNAATMQADMTDALYDAPTPAALPVNLWAKYSSNADFVLVDFDNWGGTSAGNKIQEWGFSSAHNAIYIIGNNATGNPIQLRLIKT